MLWSVDLSPIARSRRGGEECAAVIILVIPMVDEILRASRFE